MKNITATPEQIMRLPKYLSRPGIVSDAEDGCLFFTAAVVEPRLIQCVPPMGERLIHGNLADFIQRTFFIHKPDLTGKRRVSLAARIHVAAETLQL